MFSRGNLKQWLWRAAVLMAALAGITGLAGLIWLRGAIYNRFVRFPAEQKTWERIRASRERVANDAGWREFRGILHSHSKFSHDCEVPFEQILEALKSDGIDFICLSDHCTNGRADFDLQWRGVRDGKLFIPGFEMKEGIMPFGVKSGVVLSNQTDSAILAKQVIEGDGVLFYAHPEEPRVWERPELTGMEIYNTHSDFKKLGLGGILPELLLNQRTYPDQVFHLLAKRPTSFLQRWDQLNRTRHITGIAGNDCHQNTGVRGFYTTDGKLRIEDTSPKTISEFRLNFLTRPLARLFFGPLEPNRKLFHIQLDPYDRMARLVNTHVLAAELSEAAVKDALRAGRAFVAFDMVANSSGFRWLATNQVHRAVMGETTSFTPDTHLQAFSPHRCRFTVMKDGTQVHTTDGRQFDWSPGGPGKYRVEAELNIRNEWIPWIYANPIELN
jgi:hypothetical protein